MNKKQFKRLYGEVLSQTKWPSFELGDDVISDLLIKCVFLNSSLEKPKKIIFNELDFGKSIIQEFCPSVIKEQIVSPEKNDCVEEKIFSILSNPIFRKGGKNQLLKHKDIFMEKINKAVIDQEPVKLVLPTLPFKSQNPINTNQKIDCVDLSIYLMLAQLRDMDISIRKVHKPGIKIILICDGLVYADLFGNNDTQRINLFREKCIKIRNKFGLNGIVELIDMQWIIESVPNFQNVRSKVDDILSGDGLGVDAKERIFSLERGMLFNLPHKGFSVDGIVSLINTRISDLPELIKISLRKVSLDYASFLITLSIFEVISKIFPDHIRATVHPKDKPQLPLNLVNKKSSVFPYHGVCVVSQSKLLMTSSIKEASTIMRLHELTEKFSSISKIFLPGEDDVFCYIIP